MKLIPSVVLAAVLLTGCAMFGGQEVSEEQLAAWKQTAASFNVEVGEIKRDLVLVTDPTLRAKLEKRLTDLEPLVAAMNKTIQDAKTGDDAVSGAVEIGLTALAGAFPPASIALLIFRAFRRQKKITNTVFDTIETGGGPKNPTAAGEALRAEPAARKAFKDWQAEGGGAPTPA